MTAAGPGKAAVAPEPSRTGRLVLPAFQVLCVLSAFYRGFRVPSMWSLNYYQVSWADGFLRRGFLGLFFLPLGCARFDPHVIWVAQFAVLAAALFLLFSLSRRGAAAWVFCLFFLSSAGALFFNEIGYPDQLMLLLAAAGAGLLRAGRPRACAWLMAAALLIHEEATVMVLPVVALQWLCLDRRERPAPLSLLLPSFLVLTVIGTLSTSVPFSVLAHYDQTAGLCGHPLVRKDFLLYYHEPFGRQFTCYYLPLELRWVVLPLAATLALWILGGGALPGARWLERGAVWLACVLPLALGFAGTDKNRWIMLTLVQLPLLLGAVSPWRAAPRASGVWWRLPLALPLILVVLATRFTLFDGFVSRPLTRAGLSGFASYARGQFSRLPVR